MVLIKTLKVYQEKVCFSLNKLIKSGFCLYIINYLKYSPLFQRRYYKVNILNNLSKHEKIST